MTTYEEHKARIAAMTQEERTNEFMRLIRGLDDYANDSLLRWFTIADAVSKPDAPTAAVDRYNGFVEAQKAGEVESWESLNQWLDHVQTALDGKCEEE